MHELGLCETMDRVGERFGELFDAVCATQRSLVSEKSRRNVQLVKEVVAARYREPGLCVAAIADSMRMSPVYLGKIFRDACHCSIAEHITTVRLERTRELLELTSCTVKEIACEVGIDRARFLFAKFRERYGATPTAYRLRHLRNSRGRGAGARPA
jgi:YesN/AraC family two-component response regulator